MTTLSKKEKGIRWAIAICLLFLVFVPSQIPIDIAKKIIIGVLGISCLVLQMMVLPKTTSKTYKKQAYALMALTLALALTSFFL